MQNAQVIIVGAGPTGLMAANQLARFGISFIILDAKDGPTIQSRAIAVTARSMEIYQQMGLSDKVVSEGARMLALNVYSEGKRKGEVKIGEIGKGYTDFPYLMGYEQSKNEELLYENLKKNGIEVNWHTEFVSLKQENGGVTVLAKKQNAPVEYKAKYLIACDGARSLVRHQLKFKFEGGTYENKFFVADVQMSWDLGYDKIVICPAAKNFCGFFSLQGERRYRVLGTLPPVYAERSDIEFKDLEKTVLETMKLPITFEKVNWFSVYHLHHRCVDAFRSGNVFLAGDAAHIHSPAGGQGMNTGLQDVYNLAWKMAFVFKGYAKEDILETYNEERLPFAQWLMRFTDRAFSVMTSKNWFIRNFRKYFILNMVGKILSIETLRPRIFRTVSQTWYSYEGKSLTAGVFSKQELKFTAGDRLPYTGPGCYLPFKKDCFHLLHIGHKPMPNLNKVKGFRFPVQVVEDDLSVWKNFGVQSELFVLMRPDNYILLISDEWQEEKVKALFERYFEGSGED